MIATKDSFEPHSSEALPDIPPRFTSRAKFIPTCACRCARSQSRPRRSYTGAIEPNAPVRVYDCSGPWGDPNFTGTSEEGLPALAREMDSRARRRGGIRRPRSEAAGQRLSLRQTRGVRQPGGAESAGGISRPARPIAADRCARRPAKSSRSSRTPAPASSRRRWNSSPSAKTWAARKSRTWRRTSCATIWTSNTPVPAQLGKQPHYTPSIFGRFPQRIPDADHAGICAQRSRRRPRHHSRRTSIIRNSSR